VSVRLTARASGRRSRSSSGRRSWTVLDGRATAVRAFASPRRRSPASDSRSSRRAPGVQLSSDARASPRRAWRRAVERGRGLGAGADPDGELDDEDRRDRAQTATVTRSRGRARHPAEQQGQHGIAAPRRRPFAGERVHQPAGGDVPVGARVVPGRRCMCARARTRRRR
jgi:hypothetical protein